MPPTTPSRAAMPKASGAGTPGSWKHPKFDEIVRRQDARAFSDRQLAQTLKNTGALLASFVVVHLFHNSSLYSSLPRSDFFNAVYAAVAWSVTLLRLLFAYNIFDAVVGTLRGPDPVIDIPLTPDQRSTLSLPPTPSSTSVVAAAAAAGDTSHYITPPRYNKSSPLPNPPGSARPTTPTPSTPQNRSLAGVSAKTRVTSAGSPVGPGQNLLTSPGSFRSPSPGPTFNSPSPFKPLSGVEKRHSFGSPLGSAVRQTIGQGSLVAGGAGAVSPSVVASPKWLLEQRNRKRDLY
ncbi:hypothetical protein TWF696_007218 [Orbilia brochopaga]|uniref:Uncharacterized protein n=1 Tax=Orbilia brochopaga TaxID=3140254 RepID=A0AAV9USH4_9PEZI